MWYPRETDIVWLGFWNQEVFQWWRSRRSYQLVLATYSLLDLVGTKRHFQRVVVSEVFLRQAAQSNTETVLRSSELRKRSFKHLW